MIKEMNEELAINNKEVMSFINRMLKEYSFTNNGFEYQNNNIYLTLKDAGCSEFLFNITGCCLKKDRSGVVWGLSIFLNPSKKLYNEDWVAEQKRDIKNLKIDITETLYDDHFDVEKEEKYEYSIRLLDDIIAIARECGLYVIDDYTFHDDLGLAK